jgi:hypothetical protein
VGGDFEPPILHRRSGARALVVQAMEIEMAGRPTEYTDKRALLIAMVGAPWPTAAPSS